MIPNSKDAEAVKVIKQFRRTVRSFLRNKTLNPIKKYDKIYRNLLLYIDLHLARLMKYPTAPVDIIALSTRNLLEVSLWAELITQSRENLDKYYSEVYVDLKELADLVDSSESDYAKLQAAVDAVYEGGKYTELKKQRAHDRFMFKWCSKIIHPTAWSINIVMKSAKRYSYNSDLARAGFRSALRAMAVLTGQPLPTYLQK